MAEAIVSARVSCLKLRLDGIVWEMVTMERRGIPDGTGAEARMTPEETIAGLGLELPPPIAVPEGLHLPFTS
jgi:hypothetical protein